jgi:hypothetical protein
MARGRGGGSGRGGVGRGRRARILVGDQIAANLRLLNRPQKAPTCSCAPRPRVVAPPSSGIPGGQCLALGLLLIDHPGVQDERPVIVLTPTGYQAKCFISLEDSSRLLAHAEQLVKNLKIYRSRATEWGQQMDFFVGTELPEDLRRLGFVDPK